MSTQRSHMVTEQPITAKLGTVSSSVFTNAATQLSNSIIRFPSSICSFSSFTEVQSLRNPKSSSPFSAITFFHLLYLLPPHLASPLIFTSAGPGCRINTWVCLQTQLIMSFRHDHVYCRRPKPPTLADWFHPLMSDHTYHTVPTPMHTTPLMSDHTYHTVPTPMHTTNDHTFALAPHHEFRLNEQDFPPLSPTNTPATKTPPHSIPSRDHSQSNNTPATPLTLSAISNWLKTPNTASAAQHNQSRKHPQSLQSPHTTTKTSPHSIPSSQSHNDTPHTCSTLSAYRNQSQPSSPQNTTSAQPTESRKRPQSVPSPHSVTIKKAKYSTLASQHTTHQFPAITQHKPDGHIEIEGITYQLYDVPGTGSCYFYCLSLYLHGTLTKHDHYRKQICTHIYNNWDLFQDDIKLFHPNHMHTKDSYYLQMVPGLGYATHVEIRVTSQLFGININTWLQGTATVHNGTSSIPVQRFNLVPTIINAQACTMSIRLMNNHYNLLVPLIFTQPMMQMPTTTKSKKPIPTATTITIQTQTDPSSKQSTEISKAKEDSPNIVAQSPRKRKRPFTATDNTWQKPKKYNSQEFQETNYVLTPTSNNYEMLHQDICPLLTEEDTDSQQANIQTHNKATKQYKHTPKSPKTSGTLHISWSTPCSQTEQEKSAANKKLPASKKMDEGPRRKLANSLGLQYVEEPENETLKQRQSRLKLNVRWIMRAKISFKINEENTPPNLPVDTNEHINNAMIHIRAFELTQMNYNFYTCSVCCKKN